MWRGLGYIMGREMLKLLFIFQILSNLLVGLRTLRLSEQVRILGANFK